MKTLTFVHWYCKKAVYQDDTLVFYGESAGDCWLILNALGYKCKNHPREIPTHNIPKEFDREGNGWWKPPQSLIALKIQFDNWDRRLRTERIAALQAELNDLSKQAIVNRD